MKHRPYHCKRGKKRDRKKETPMYSRHRKW